MKDTGLYRETVSKKTKIQKTQVGHTSRPITALEVLPQTAGGGKGRKAGVAAELCNAYLA